jgi:hypothetical protein
MLFDDGLGARISQACGFEFIDAAVSKIIPFRRGGIHLLGPGEDAAGIDLRDSIRDFCRLQLHLFL